MSIITWIVDLAGAAALVHGFMRWLEVIDR